MFGHHRVLVAELMPLSEKQVVWFCYNMVQRLREHCGSGVSRYTRGTVGKKHTGDSRWKITVRKTARVSRILAQPSNRILVEDRTGWSASPENNREWAKCRENKHPLSLASRKSVQGRTKEQIETQHVRQNHRSFQRTHEQREGLVCGCRPVGEPWTNM